MNSKRLRAGYFKYDDYTGDQVRKNIWEPSMYLTNVEVSVFFDNLQVEFINILENLATEYHELTIVSCMAWLSEKKLLNVFARIVNIASF